MSAKVYRILVNILLFGFVATLVLLFALDVISKLI